MKHKEQRLPIFAERFRELQGDMSNTEFAAHLGMSRQTVGFYLNGDRVPDALALRQIADKCHVSTDWLLGLSVIREKDAEIQAINAYTGLSNDAIYKLHRTKNEHPRMEVTNFLLEDNRMLVYLTNYLSSFLMSKLSKPPYKYIPLKSGATFPYMKAVFFSAVTQHLPDMWSKFEEKYDVDEKFIDKSLFSFLARNADIAACNQIVGEDFPDFAEEPEFLEEYFSTDDYNAQQELFEPEHDEEFANELHAQVEAVESFLARMNAKT